MEKQSKTIEQVFGERLTNAMKWNDMTRLALAERIGITRQAIGQYMDGKSIPTSDKLAKIAKALDVSCDYLLGLSDQPRVDIDAPEKDIGLNAESIVHLRALQKRILNDNNDDLWFDVVEQQIINSSICRLENMPAYIRDQMFKSYALFWYANFTYDQSGKTEEYLRDISSHYDSLFSGNLLSMIFDHMKGILPSENDSRLSACQLIDVLFKSLSSDTERIIERMKEVKSEDTFFNMLYYKKEYSKFEKLRDDLIFMKQVLLESQQKAADFKDGENDGEC